MTKTIDTLKAAASKYTTEQITAAIREIGGSFDVDTDTRMVRAALIDIYAERTSSEAADSLMDEIGM